VVPAPDRGDRGGSSSNRVADGSQLQPDHLTAWRPREPAEVDWTAAARTRRSPGFVRTSDVLAVVHMRRRPTAAAITDLLVAICEAGGRGGDAPALVPTRVKRSASGLRRP
jgi:hypothetical protein